MLHSYYQNENTWRYYKTWSVQETFLTTFKYTIEYIQSFGFLYLRYITTFTSSTIIFRPSLPRPTLQNHLLWYIYLKLFTIMFSSWICMVHENRWRLLYSFSWTLYSCLMTVLEEHNVYQETANLYSLHHQLTWSVIRMECVDLRKESENVCVPKVLKEMVFDNVKVRWDLQIFKAPCQVISRTLTYNGFLLQILKLMESCIIGTYTTSTTSTYIYF